MAEMKEVSGGRETLGIQVPPPRLNFEALRPVLGYGMTHLSGLLWEMAFGVLASSKARTRSED